jgi:hypothetical protein
MKIWVYKRVESFTAMKSALVSYHLHNARRESVILFHCFVRYEMRVLLVSFSSILGDIFTGV